MVTTSNPLFVIYYYVKIIHCSISRSLQIPSISCSIYYFYPKQTELFLNTQHILNTSALEFSLRKEPKFES